MWGRHLGQAARPRARSEPALAPKSTSMTLSALPANLAIDFYVANDHPRHAESTSNFPSKPNTGPKISKIYEQSSQLIRPRQKRGQGISSLTPLPCIPSARCPNSMSKETSGWWMVFIVSVYGSEVGDQLCRSEHLESGIDLGLYLRLPSILDDLFTYP